LTGDRLIRKALLSGTNKEAVKKYEDLYFKDNYGKWF